MGKKFFWFVLLVVFFCKPAAADEVFDMAGGGNIYGELANGMPANQVENLNLSFLYDLSTNSVSNISFSATGMFAPGFAFTGVTNNGADTLFDWSDGEAILSAAYPDAQRADPGDGEGTKAITVDCLTSACSALFPQGGPVLETHLLAMAETPTPTSTPEPSSGLLLISGAAGLCLLIRRRPFARNRLAGKTL